MDAKAKGMPGLDAYQHYQQPGATTHDHRDQFQRLWDEIKAKRGHPWERNPWVWVLEFKKVEQ